MGILRLLWKAMFDLFNDGGFSIAGSVAFSLVLALFPFFIFVGAMAGFLGGPELAAIATEQLFLLLPKEVAAYLVPQIESVLGQSRYGLMTVGGVITLFFASSGIESLRWALNISYEDKDMRSVFWLRLQSFGIVVVTALVSLFLAYTVVVAPLISAFFGAKLTSLLPEALVSSGLRYTVAGLTVTAMLFAFHAWLPAGHRRFRDLWPGVLLTLVLWGMTAYGFSFYLSFTQYGAIYAGLSQVVIALMFFYVVAAIMILGAEFNHARLEARGEGGSGSANLLR